MQGVVDRLEAEFVVIEIDGDTQDFPKTAVANDVKAGDVVDCVNGCWVRNEAETNSRSQKMKNLMDSVWED